MTHVFHRHCHTQLPTVAWGSGVYLIDSEGKQYLDACGGAAVSNLGHSHQRVKEAISHQLARVPYAHSGFFTSESSETLAKRLTELAPSDLNHAYFVSGGSEAVEAALKLARQYFVEIDMPQKCQFIARRQSYHGNTLGALSVGGNTWRREPFKPILSTSHHIAPCYAYREQLHFESEQAYSRRAADELEQKILELGAENVMAFIAEPVVGATAGAVPATDGYFKRIREICNRYDVLLILDEVMCGVGRTGTFFAFEQEGIEPDIIAVAKGLGAGYQPIGATLVHDKIYAAIANGSGFFQHGHTFMCHPMACAAALATIDTIIEDNLLAVVRSRGSQLMEKLHQALGSLPYVGDIRGRGLFIGIELVADKQSKSPLPAASKAHKAIQSTAMANGLMCYPMSGTIDGHLGHHILLAPPFIIEEHQLDELVAKLEKSLLTASTHWM
ncbi:aspartate aminotransferase family protein [Photobacterium sanctipauli]|uniref:Aspartate aminotransferase family protein n=1 Tax=Photobacterium sanctipauli TaxID=1342794 RepID=A0A2T3NWU1_9GAMM|nr:aspartate aminotransferase family protein [Photobacterium sanctipauli]PSW20735.1 aspartate aminotransferase family protein [Photobacterium sanctipauli]